MGYISSMRYQNTLAWWLKQEAILLNSVQPFISLSKVQARKETLDHVSEQEKCLNLFLSQGINLVGIKKALLKNKLSIWTNPD